MTRLEPADISGLDRDLKRFDGEVLAKTGRSLRQIACRAAGTDEERILRVMEDTTVGVVPVTAGEGIISGFAETVRDIIRHLGFRAFVPDLVDVAGLTAAVEEGADILFMADDARFIALNLSTCRLVDNAEATGRGYVAALEGLAGGLRGCRVLVIGAGKVGTAAARMLQEVGAEIGVFDMDGTRSERLAGKVKGRVEWDLEQALARYTGLIDACQASGIIEAKHIRPTTIVAAPGIPLGLTDEARLRVEGRLVHDPLQIGVATMMISAIV